MIKLIVKQRQKKTDDGYIAFKAYKVTIDGHSRIFFLNSDQQETDSRLLLHAKHADEADHNILISGKDIKCFSHYLF